MSIAGEALSGVGLWITRRERKQERDDAAVRSVLTAVNTTKRYLARRERGDPIDLDAEAELVELWTSAAVHIRRTDPDLAQRLLQKADYWTNPENWSDEDVIANGIRIEEIADEGKHLLGNV
jgi:hypothetical protein